MSSISGISSTSAYSGSVSSVKRQRPDPAQMAEQAFSKLDTKGQGYLEVSDLESAFSNIASVSGSTSGSDATSTASDLFKKLDADSDGKVTKDEFSSGLKKLADDLESQFNQSRTSGVGQDRGAPPPPPPSGTSETSGNSTGAVSSVSTTASSSATNSTSDTTASKTYEAADTNQDGKVTQKEEEAYLLKLLEAKAAASGDKGTQQAGAANNNSEATLFKKAIQLLQAYSSPSESNSQSISVSV